MTGKIFRSILLVAGTVLAASLLVIMGCLYEYFGGVEQKQLRDELELASAAVAENSLTVRSFRPVIEGYLAEAFAATGALSGADEEACQLEGTLAKPVLKKAEKQA